MDSILLILKALSDRNRLRIVFSVISYEELCVFQFVELLQIKGATVSRHLTQLVRAGILKNRKEGRWVYYSLNETNKIILPVLKWLTLELSNDVAIAADLRLLRDIILQDPEEICRKQRGEACCPIKKDK